MSAAPRRRIYGLMAEFDDPTALVDAARARARGRLPADGRLLAVPDRGAVARRSAIHHRRLPLLVLIGGIVGGVGGYGCSTGRRSIDYPLNVGGRPLHSWPAFIPITFETTILVAALAAVLGMLALNGLPMPYHPVFNVPRFALATRDRSSSASRRPTRSSTATRRGAFLDEPRARARSPKWSTDAAPRARARGARRSPLSAGAGCRQDMHDQPKYEPLEASEFFADGRAVAAAGRGHGRARPAPRGRAPLHRQDGTTPLADAARCPSPRASLDARPRALRHLLLACHGRVGRGRRHGRAARLPRAAVVPHRPAARRSRSATSSTSSPTASARCRTTRRRSRSQDRWAIVAYVRALQLSQNATLGRRARRSAARRSAEARPP